MLRAQAGLAGSAGRKFGEPSHARRGWETSAARRTSSEVELRGPNDARTVQRVSRRDTGPTQTDHVTLAELLCGRRAAQRLPLGAGVFAGAHGSEMLLGELAGLFDGEHAEDAEAGLAPLAGWRSVRQHENLAPGGRISEPSKPWAGSASGSEAELRRRRQHERGVAASL